MHRFNVFIKLTALVLVTVMSIMVLAACEEPANNNDTIQTTPGESGITTTPPDDISTAPSETGRILASKDGCEYAIVRSEYGDDILTQASVDLKNALVAKFGNNAAPALKTDWEMGVARDEYIETDTYEILIGHTNRVETETVLKEIAENSYAVKWVNKKLVIVGFDDYATKNAVTAFINNYVKTATGDQLMLPMDINVSGQGNVQKIDMADGADIRVMTFNILGSSDGYDDGRMDLIIQTVLDYMPDVVGFQESNKTNLNTIHTSKAIAKYYNINKSYHTNGTTANYTPILYLKAKYKQIEGGVEWNNSRYTGTNTKSMSWTVLERLADGQRFIVVNIHGSLWSSSYTPPAGETHSTMEAVAKVAWKLDNVEQILAKIDELQAKYGNLPVFTTGDYNFNNTHEAYKLMKSTGLANAQESAKDANTSYASGHKTVGQMPAKGGLAIDHIFYSPDSIEAIKHDIGMRTDDICASDHCPVYTDFIFKK